MVIIIVFVSLAFKGEIANKVTIRKNNNTTYFVHVAQYIRKRRKTFVQWKKNQKTIFFLLFYKNDSDEKNDVKVTVEDPKTKNFVDKYVSVISKFDFI